MTDEVIPIAEGGTGRYTWNGSKAYHATYRVRRGAAVVASVVLDDSLPFHSAIVTEFCAVLDRIERDEAT